MIDKETEVEYERCPSCGRKSIAELVDLPEMREDEHYRLCVDCQPDYPEHLKG